jgi:predicted dehydrogenase
MAMRNGKQMNRRDFIATSALSAAAFTIVPRSVLGGTGQTAPSEKLNIAGIGFGGMGAPILRNMETENIVALCDVDDQYAAATFNRYPNAKRYRDYRKMLEEQKDIDAVLIATPDHTHAVITIAAMQAGKHVYCQKPLTHTVYEARQVAKIARETNVVTQMGNQGRSGEGVRLICEWIAAGAIGEVREVDAWSNESYYPWNHASWSPASARRPAETPPVPETLDWDLWLGPAQSRPYHPCYHPVSWRAWWDFGCGWMGDRGAHTLDAVYWALQLGHPTSIEGTVSDFNEDTHPVASIVRYQFPARGTLPPVKLTWYEGLLPPRPDELEEGRKMGDVEGGGICKGDKGKLMCGTYGHSPQLIPYSAMQAYEKPPQTIARVNEIHEQGWIEAIKKGQKASSDFSISGPLTEIVLLGNVAKRMQTKLNWDGDNLKITNVPEANQYLTKQYRENWSV